MRFAIFRHAQNEQVPFNEFEIGANINRLHVMHLQELRASACRALVVSLQNMVLHRSPMWISTMALPEFTKN